MSIKPLTALIDVVVANAVFTRGTTKDDYAHFLANVLTVGHAKYKPPDAHTMQVAAAKRSFVVLLGACRHDEHVTVPRLNRFFSEAIIRLLRQRDAEDAQAQEKEEKESDAEDAQAQEKESGSDSDSDSDSSSSSRSSRSRSRSSSSGSSRSSSSSSSRSRSGQGVHDAHAPMEVDHAEPEKAEPEELEKKKAEPEKILTLERENAELLAALEKENAALRNAALISNAKIAELEQQARARDAARPRARAPRHKLIVVASGGVPKHKPRKSGFYSAFVRSSFARYHGTRYTAPPNKANSASGSEAD